MGGSEHFAECYSTAWTYSSHLNLIDLNTYKQGCSIIAKILITTILVNTEMTIIEYDFLLTLEIFWISWTFFLKLYSDIIQLKNK